MDATVVVVHGEARREVPPEQAVFSVTVSAADRDKATVLSRLTRRAAEVGEILERHDVTAESTGIQLHPEFDRRGERAVRYSGTVTSTVTVTDSATSTGSDPGAGSEPSVGSGFDRLGGLLAQLAAGDLVSVSGPWWQLRPGSRAGADVRREAVTDALDRAREYASAVGSTLSRIVEIADAETDGPHPMMRAATFEAADAGFDLAPVTQVVTARVRLKVTITDPVIS